MPSSNKTGLVLKISLVLFVLLALLVYKLNDYFRNEKLFTQQTQLRNRVISYKTTVSGQLQQLKNTLSAFDTEISDSNINWIQLAPFFAIARVAPGTTLKVLQIVGRSNTPAERWNAAYLEKALSINRSRESNPILVQLFQDRARAKYLIIRFAMADKNEIAVIGSADYFQKYFDIERGSDSTSLLVTTENILAAHTEGDYIATSTKEAQLSPKKYLFEKEEIVGTNLLAINYLSKKKVASGFAVPWSIVGVVAGFGFVLIGILFYTLDPIEKRVERFKKQERDQIFKDTVGEMKAAEPIVAKPISLANPMISAETETQTSAVIKRTPPPITEVSGETVYKTPIPEPVVVVSPEPVPAPMRSAVPKDYFDLMDEVPVTPEKAIEPPILKEHDETRTTAQANDQFLTLDEEKIDLDEIEKALALDEFDDDRHAQVGSDVLENNLKPQKISVSATGAPIEKPHFTLDRKDFKVDQIKVHIRRPERS